MSDSSDETTDPVDAVPDAVPDDAAPDTKDEPVDPALPGDDPVRTVTRKGALLGAAGALVVGGLVGWVAADAFGDDEVSVPISAFQEGGGGRFHGWGHGPMGGGFFFHGGPGGGPFGPGFPGPGGGWQEDGERGVPPWMGEDGLPPWMDEHHDDGDGDGPGDDEGDQPGQSDDGDERESPSTTTQR